MITAAYAESDIDVVVPATAEAVINPYGLGVSMTTSEGVKKQLAGQIMTPALTIKNKSNMKLDVNATVTAVIAEGSTMKLNAASTKGTPDLAETNENYVAPATGKNAFVQLELATTSLTGEEGDELEDKIIDAASKAASWTSSKKLTVGTKPVTSEEPLVTLNAGMTANDEAFESYKTGSIALFRLSGDCVTAPKGGWAETDGFTVTVVFSFSPAA